MIPRIDEIDGPPKVGRTYLVPTVTATWLGRFEPWPVLGPKHNDRHCLNFDHDHYHLDIRFLRQVSRGPDFWQSAFAMPLMSRHCLNPGGLRAPVWQAMSCKRLENPALPTMQQKAAANAGWRCHFDEWTGKQARHDGRGWVCPHRNVSLASQPIIAGVVTCSLHLLRIDATTGVVLPPLQDGGVAA